MRLIKTLEVNNELGEGVIWDHSANKLWWSDIQQSKLYRYDIDTDTLEDWSTPERLCCFAPRTNAEGLVAAFESGFAFYRAETGAIEWLHKIEADNPGTRLNDGRTDRQGRLWAGTMVEDQERAQYKGALYCLDEGLNVKKSIEGLLITNSLCWSPDGETMYHTDTPTRRIKQYAFDTKAGDVGEAQLLVETRKGCYPDGSIVDADGFIWNAQWGSSTVVRYAPDGREDLVVEIPTQQPSCVAFAGQDLNLLCVTSAWQDLDSSARAQDTQAGNLFIYETEFKGIKEQAFKR